jgi:hypothetical protein
VTQDTACGTRVGTFGPRSSGATCLTSLSDRHVADLNRSGSSLYVQDRRHSSGSTSCSGKRCS